MHAMVLHQIGEPLVWTEPPHREPDPGEPRLGSRLLHLPDGFASGGEGADAAATLLDAVAAAKMVV